MLVQTEQTPTGKSPTVIQWVVDTRRLWLGAGQTAELSQVAEPFINLLPQEERREVLRYVRVKDAKMTLASRLIKRYAIARFCEVPWREATSTRDRHSKPVFRRADGSEPLLFNITHQDGLVLLFGVADAPADTSIGVDVVSPSERRDHDHSLIAKEGWASFVDIHAEVFGHAETQQLKELHFDPSTDNGRDQLLRYFYSLWCLREAYVKMTGEALLASWLRELEIFDFAPPEVMSEKASGYQAWVSAKKVPKLDIKLKDLLEKYMVATVVRNPEYGDGLQLGSFRDLVIEEILKFVKESTS